MSTVFNTPKAVAMYPYLDKLDMNGKYSVILTFEKGSEGIKTMQAEYAKAEKEFFPNGLPAIYKQPFRDGNEKKYVDKKTNEEKIRAGFENTVYITVRSKDKPPVLDPTGKKMMPEGSVQHGSVVILGTNAYAWEFSGKQGISFGFNSLQITGEHRNIPGGGGRPDPMTAHADVSGEATLDPENDPANYPEADNKDESMFD